MYSGLLPKGLTEDDLSPDEEKNEEEKESEKLRTKEESAASPAEAQPGVGGWDAYSETQCSLPGISQEMWQKFKDLQKRKEETKTIEVPRKRKRRRKKTGDKDSSGVVNSDAQLKVSREPEKEREKHWDELKQYFGANDRFQPPSSSKPPPKSGLEKSIERAIAEGDIAKAEEMSDSLATRELAVKIAQAADCRDYAKRKQEEEDLKAAQKRKKQIAWGFEAKKRWETKSNMGFM